MARDMFYKYDIYANNDDPKCCENNLFACDKNNQAEYAYSLKGDLLGLKVKQDSAFTIYFNFSSEDDLELFDLLHSCPIVLDIAKSDGEIVESFYANVCEHINECSIFIDLCNCRSLKKGKYKLYLYYIEDNNKNLLYDEANLLSIK